MSCDGLGLGKGLGNTFAQQGVPTKIGVQGCMHMCLCMYVCEHRTGACLMVEFQVNERQRDFIQSRSQTAESLEEEVGQ